MTKIPPPKPAIAHAYAQMPSVSCRATSPADAGAKKCTSPDLNALRKAIPRPGKTTGIDALRRVTTCVTHDDLLLLWGGTTVPTWLAG
jgi:hypothetical protein